MTMTTLADLTLAAQLKADRVNGPWPVTDWYSWVNESAQELYGILTSTHEDYNVKPYSFSMPGGSETGNQIQLGPGSSVPDFFQPRLLEMQIQAPTPYVVIPRLNSLQEIDLYTYPQIVPVYGTIPSGWYLVGATLGIVPPAASGANYRLRYIPQLPKLIAPTDSLDAFWLTLNGWDSYVACGAAREAARREESYELVQSLEMKMSEIRTRILLEAKPRDVSQPAGIVDMQRVRNNAGLGYPGNLGYGWGRDSGGGNW